jgi:predicted TIM-barrel fold metal-dependent hydrolase
MDYEVISTDSHLEVSPDNWRPFVDEEFQEFCPRVEKQEDGGDAWVMPGTGRKVALGLNFFSTSSDPTQRWRTAKPSGVSYDEGLVGTGDAHQRLSEMDLDGVDAELLFPAVSGQRTLSGIPREAYNAVVRGYNNWVSNEFCAVNPERLLGVAMLPTTGVEDVIAEYRRASQLPGMVTASLPNWPNGTGAPAPEDDVFWQAAVETGFPVCAHATFGSGATADTRIPPGVRARVNFAPINAMLTGKGHYTATQLITEGVLDRFPTLEIFFAETGIGWIPNYLEHIDDEYRRHRYWAGLDLAHEPSWYIRKHFWWGFQIDNHGVESRDDIGVDHIMWATDFPHMNCDWPESRRVIKEQFADVPDDEVRKMICENAIKFLKLNDRVLTTR